MKADKCNIELITEKGIPLMASINGTFYMDFDGVETIEEALYQVFQEFAGEFERYSITVKDKKEWEERS